jgi:hypothetical protein
MFNGIRLSLYIPVDKLLRQFCGERYDQSETSFFKRMGVSFIRKEPYFSASLTRVLGKRVAID